MKTQPPPIPEPYESATFDKLYKIEDTLNELLAIGMEFMEDDGSLCFEVGNVEMTIRKRA